MKFITGTFADAAGGFLLLALNQYALIGYTSKNAPRTYHIPLASDGSIPANTKIWGNDELMPEGTEYRATITDTSGTTVIRGPWVIQICGPREVDLTNLIPVTPQVSASGRKSE